MYVGRLLLVGALGFQTVTKLPKVLSTDVAHIPGLIFVHDSSGVLPILLRDMVHAVV
jgi:hypothetical protein